ncbi:PHP domain-containing protein [Polyangium sorediatum]|uniref:DNA-directed DNA polymerase n=1 Tax=Polyangium sorediatum TaxID=889274 RepID=A0ABT6NKB1_9BACT|nr:PHP domain-containing protein [Polyangium sorediatum]MDI1428746.1 PHP domain-containing protein [Polyangium sorediatum]
MSTMVDKLDVARALREIGALLRCKGESSFKVQAYENGSAAVEAISEDLGRLVEEGRLTQVPGIGASLASVITELVRTGQSELHVKLRAELPPGVLELCEIPGLSPKKVQALHDALGITSVEELRQACLAGRVRSVKGFGLKTQQSLLEAIAQRETREARVLLVDALGVAEPLLDHLRAFPEVKQADLAGDVRRFCETVSDVHVVVASDEAGVVLDHAERFPRVTRVRCRDAQRVDLCLAGDVPASVHVVAPAHYAGALLMRTGSSAHLAELGRVATEQGLALDEARALVRIESDAQIYRALGLHPVPPELREGDGEIEAARQDDFADLVTQGDIQGMVHCHTVFSDGNDTIEDMARAAEAMGMKYLTITDHSPTAHYARGVELDRLKLQWDEIARVQERVKIKLLRGTESDILATGALDYPDAILEQLDVVIASVHSRMKMDEAAMTQRLVEAMRQPIFKIWGHPLGRLLLRREPFACRVEEVLDVIASSRAAIEVNGDPYRLDMEPRWLKEARKRGIRFVISTDAHSTKGLSSLRFGVGMARRGGLRRSEVLNALGPEGFAAAVRPIH